MSNQTNVAIVFIDDVGGSNTVVKTVTYNTCGISEGQEAFQLCVDALDKWTGINNVSIKR